MLPEWCFCPFPGCAWCWSFPVDEMCILTFSMSVRSYKVVNTVLEVFHRNLLGFLDHLIRYDALCGESVFFRVSYVVLSLSVGNPL